MRGRLESEIRRGLGRQQDIANLNVDQPVVGLISSALSFEKLPDVDIWDPGLAALGGAQSEIRAGRIEAAAQRMQEAANAISGAHAKLSAYQEATIKGAERAEFALEVVQTAAAVTVSVGTGGLAGVAVGTGYGAAQQIARQGSELSLGMRQEIDWAGITFDSLVGLVTGLLGGKAGNKLFAALVKNPAVASLGRRAVSRIVSDLVSGRLSTLLLTAARTVFDGLRGKQKLTVENFIDALIATLTDPKQYFLDAILGVAQRKGQAAVESHLANVAVRRALPKAGQNTAPTPETAQTQKPASTPATELEPPRQESPSLSGEAPSTKPLDAPDARQSEPQPAPSAPPAAASQSVSPVETTPAAPDVGLADRGYRPAAGERTETRQQYKARTGAERWKAAVDKAFADDVDLDVEVPKVKGGLSSPRIEDKSVPVGEAGSRKPESSLDIDNLPRRPGEKPRQAVARVRTVITQTLDSIPALSKHWDAARTDVLKKYVLTQDNYVDLYDKTRVAFWRRVRRDAAARQFLTDAGFDFSGGATAAPVLAKVPATVPVEETRISLDHVKEKAQGSNWKYSLDASNLRMEFARPNTEREIKQMRHPELR